MPKLRLTISKRAGGAHNPGLGRSTRSMVWARYQAKNGARLIAFTLVLCYRRAVLCGRPGPAVGREGPWPTVDGSSAPSSAPTARGTAAGGPASRTVGIAVGIAGAPSSPRTWIDPKRWYDCLLGSRPVLFFSCCGLLLVGCFSNVEPCIFFLCCGRVGGVS